MSNVDNQIGPGDTQSQTWLTNAITAYENVTNYQNISTAVDTQQSKDLGVIVTQLTNEQNRLHGKLCLAPMSTADSGKYGGSIVPQVNVGAKMF